MTAYTVKIKCPIEGCELIRGVAAITVHLRKAHGVVKERVAT